MTDMKISNELELLETSILIPYVRNSRTHSDAQVQQIASSIKEFGFTNPILIDESNGIIAGHGRLLAAQLLKIKSVPCIRLGYLSESQKRAYVIADNKLGLNAGWDDALLALELKDLQLNDFDLSLTGFNEDELAKLLVEAVEGQTDPDDVPDVQETAITVLGDIWTLGRHRLMCGDSTSIDSVDKLMEGKKADMVFTSPPYNADTKAGDGSIFNNKKSVILYSEGYSDNLSSENYIKFASDVLEVCFLNTDGFIFWNVSYNAKSKNEYIKQFINRLDYLVEQICWKKNSAIPFKGMLKRSWEPIYVFSTNKQNLNVKEVTENFWQVSNRNSQIKEHKACFPVELPEKGISLVNKNSGIIFEPFCGSGTTIIASEKNNRMCRGMEIDPKYCDVIIRRWQDFSGKKAVHSETGKTFEEIADERSNSTS